MSQLDGHRVARSLNSSLSTTPENEAIATVTGNHLLEGTGVETNAIHVQDLAIWLPLAAVAAVWLRRSEPRGSLVARAVLGMWVIEGVSIAVDQWFGVRADPDSPVVSLAVVPPFLALAVVGLVPLRLLLRGTGDIGAGREQHEPRWGRRSLLHR